MELFRLISFLDEKLCNENFKDYAINGLQVENNGKINKIYSAVDSNIATLKKCSKDSLLIVHHGLFWGKPFTITKSDYKKVEYLIKNNIALYASHLPLDANPDFGNNAMILNNMGAKIEESFGKYGIGNIGFRGSFEKPVNIQDVFNKFEKTLNRKPSPFLFSDTKEIKTVCAVSGGPGMDILNEFFESGIDLLLTGETSHILYNFAEDNGLNILCGGHYATEIFGVKELTNILSKEFSLKEEFIEHSTGL
jgi:dinuclear metal center YbgI/SA1388 family protein